MTLRQTLEAYGTSEGVKKAWESRSHEPEFEFYEIYHQKSPWHDPELVDVHRNRAAAVAKARQLEESGGGKAIVRPFGKKLSQTPTQ